MYKDRYEIVRMDFSDSYDMQRLVNLQNAVYEGKHTFTSDVFKFWYLDNPNGRVVSLNAITDSIIAAHYALVPVRMDIEGKTCLGLLSMATVTHPDHRGQGLFKVLAGKTYEYAKESGYSFVIGVANDNSYPGFIKYFDFDDIGRLDVLCGFSKNLKPNGEKTFKYHWDEGSVNWRLSDSRYGTDGRNYYGTIGISFIKKFPLVKTFMGVANERFSKDNKLKKFNSLTRPINLYVGMGSNAKEVGYHEVPKFIKHSPFHLIFMDLTGGKLPKMTRDNIFFQLMDFDVV